MSNQYLKLRRSAVPGKVPDTASLDFGEIALNTYDGLAYMKVTGSFGQKVLAIGVTSGSFTGSLFGTASWAINAISSSYPFKVTASLNASIYSVTAGERTSNDYSYFIGYKAGLSASNSTYSTYIGDFAGAVDNNNSTYAHAGVMIGSDAGYNANNSFLGVYIGNRAGMSATNASASVIIGNQAGESGSQAGSSTMIGSLAGYFASQSRFSVFIGDNAGNRAAGAYETVAIGYLAGALSSPSNQNAANAFRSVFIGSSAGAGSTNAANSIAIGYQSGLRSINASSSVFLGYQAGATASFAGFSNFLGYRAGYNNYNAEYSNFIGYNAGINGGSLLGRNNIIIGTNITLPTGYSNYANIGGAIFVSGTYSTVTGNPSQAASNGKVGINVVNPTQATLEVGGNVYAQSFTGSLFGTASWAINAITASYALNAGTANVSGSQYYVAVFSSSNSVRTGSIYDSGSFTAIGTTTPTDPTSPERFFVDASDTDSYNLISGHGTINNYLQLNIKNFSSGATGSSDIVATANNGDETSFFIDMGVNSSGYNLSDGIGGSNDAYLYSTAQDLLIGNASAGKRVIIFNGSGPALDNARLYITSQGTVGINASDNSLSNPEALLVEPLVSGAAAPNDFNNLIIGRGTVNESYLQLNIINKGSGSYASADIVATNNVGTETSNYIDMGINSSNHIVDTTFAPGGPNDSYLLSTANDLLIGSSTSGDVVLWTGANFDDIANAKLTLRPTNRHSLTGSLSATQGFTGSLYGTASWAQNALTSSISINAATASSADDFVVRNSLTASNAIINGILTAQTLVVQTVTSSVIYSSGSNVFGNNLSNTQVFTGSVSITGSLSLNGNNVITSNQTSSLSVLSASYSLSSSLSENAITASFAQTASYVLNAISASYVSGSAAIVTNLTSSNDANINGLRIGRGAGGDFRNVALGTTGGPAGGANNTAVGYLSANLTTGNSNTAYGAQALLNNTISSFNTAIGVSSLQANTGIGNTGVGINTLLNNATGSYNVAVGFRAGQYITGLAQNSSSSYSIYIGTDSKAFTNGGTNEIVIGYDAIGSGSNTVSIGNSSITVTQLQGSVRTTGAFTGSLFGTASWAQNSITASYALNAAIDTGSLLVTASAVNTTITFTKGNGTTFDVTVSQSGSISSASYADFAVSASYAVSSSLAISSSYAYTASSAVSSTNALTASSADNLVVRQSITASNALINGTITAQTLIVQTVTSSIVYSSGSNIFGNNLSNTQQFTGSVSITGSLSLNGNNVITSNQTASMSVLSASYASTASYALNEANVFPFTGSAIITGSLVVTGSTSLQVLNIGASQFNNTSSITSAGTTIISSINTGSFTSAFYNYTIASASNARSGQVMSVWNGSTVRYTEVTTMDIGNTATASFAVVLSGNNVNLNLSAPGVWTVKNISNLL